jgi:ABC-2 type transport system ATP-binding protein
MREGKPVAETLIEVESLVKAVHQGEIVIDSLSVQAGQVVGLFGANGAGKTAVLKMIAGLLAPDAGYVRLNGYDLAAERENALQQVAAVIQGGYSLGERCSALENLSHGLRRRAALTCALVARRPILLLDEPLLGLDDCAAQAIETCIRTQVRAGKKAILVATCSQRLVREICDRVAVIRDGRLAAGAPVNRSLGLSRRAYYRLRIEGDLGDCEDWFGGLKMTTAWDETTLFGPVVDQPALHGLLIRIRDLGLSLVSLERIHPGLEEAL